MKKELTKGLLAALLLGSTTLLNAQTIDVDRTKYPDYSEEINPDWSLMAPQSEAKAQSLGRSASQRPDHVHNGLNRHFPPVFNQDGGSCGSASRISYMFSYELAAYRDLDGKDPHNYYPSHFVWLHTNSPGSPTGQGKDEFITRVGVPSAATYGGQTYSSLFGNQDAGNNDFGWMQGYDKWYEAMHNRMLKPSNFPVNVGTEEGREAVKNWLWNHNGDDSYAAGGICGIGVASGGVWEKIPSTTANKAAGVSGMYYVRQWGTTVDHALTIVGYDDRIEFDLDNDGIYGEREADELGAWIIVNSWGNWCDGGFIYCPYAHGVPSFNGDGSVPNNFWTPEVYKVRKDYRPLRTIKLEMDYSRRSEIALSAGISADLNATEPEKSIPFVHFSYSGDGNYGNSNPAPEIPMLGRWADGKLHTEPMEFGYDLTDLSAEFDMSQPLKYFFIVDTRAWAQGEGTIHGASIIDYRSNELGIETSFNVGDGIEIRNAGEKTIISVIVQGSGYGTPQNVAYTDGTLSWQAPSTADCTVTGYNVTFNGSHVATLPADTRSYTAVNAASLGEYEVSAVYSDGGESDHVVVRVPLAPTEGNVGINYNHAGFTIPDIMTPRYDEATIEFWLKPSYLDYWSHSGGAGLSTFFFYATQYGQYFAGWNNGEGDGYAYTYNVPLAVGKWSHVAIVVEKNLLSLYVNGTRLGQRKSSKYSGVGGFGDLVFASNDAIAPNGAQHGVYDEVRVWNVARTQDEIKACMNTEFTGSVMPKGLVTYLRGDLITDAEGNQRLYDYAGGHHASLVGNYEVVSTKELGLGISSETPAISINEPKGIIYAGTPVILSATYNTAVTRMVWSAEGAGIEDIATTSPMMTFATAGTYTVSVTAYTSDGNSTVATRDIIVAEALQAEATFTMTPTKVPAGERITLHADNPQIGYSYHWSMPGADDEEATSPSVATIYQAKGTYNVTLTVIAPDGSKRSHTGQVEVVNVAPKAAFSITPAVVVKDKEVEFIDESLYAPTYWKWHLGSDKTNYILYDQYKTFTIDKPGVYDVTLTAGNSEGSSKLTRERALIVTNADSKNGLNFSNENATITVGMPPFTAGQSTFTIDWWMNCAQLNASCNGIGENEQTMIIKSDDEGKMGLYIGKKKAISVAGFVIPGEWHHYAITLASGTVKFYRDGVLRETKTLSSSTTVPAIGTFSIGTTEAPFKGSIDELRVWKKALTEAQLRTYANAPITNIDAAESSHGLKLYYDFNQGGGDVKDLSSNAYHGSRTGFGPDGDAWGLSKGVFFLNFDEATNEDVTATYLKNYTKTFTTNGTCINTNLPNRTFGIKEWTLENTKTTGDIITGAHVDMNKAQSMTITTGWDGFASALYNHKVFQTMTLPAGYYTFTAEYAEGHEGQCGTSYLVAAKGNTLPGNDELEKAISYSAMKVKDQEVAANSMSFDLAEETTVSIGLLVNMSGNSCMTLQRFTLVRSELTIYEKESDALLSMDKLSNDKLYYISLPHHTEGLISWAITQGEGATLKSNVDLGVKTDRDDTKQQFAILSNNMGITHYLYHAAEKKFVNKEGMLTDEPEDPIYFKEGAYDTTYVAYFDETHYINVGSNQQMIINDYATPDGGNSIIIRLAKSFNPEEALTKFPFVAVTGIMLNHSKDTLMVGDALVLQALVTPSYATDPTVTWSSSDNSVAIVDRGIVSAVAPGTTTITAKAGDIEATCVVTVEERRIEVMGIIMSQTEATITEGEQLTLSATVVPENAEDKTITWETSDPAIATVQDGVVTALVPGKVTITAKAGSREATCVVTINKRYVPVTDIILDYTELTLQVGEKVKLSATVLPENADNPKVTWNSSNKKVASIFSTTLTAKSVGTTIITAKTNDYSVSFTVTVIEAVADDVSPVIDNEPTLMIYDLTGRPVRLNAKSTQGLNPGIYFINGRKVVIK